MYNRYEGLGPHWRDIGSGINDFIIISMKSESEKTIWKAEQLNQRSMNYGIIQI